jgi:8-amino-7-oxononanoate synthase
MRRDQAAIDQALSRLDAMAQRRQRALIEAYPVAGNSTRVRVAGRELLNFCSNDYLGLAQHPALVEAQCAAAREFGAGSGAAHLISGHSLVHQRLEAELAEFTGRERALLFSTGYMANLGVLSALGERGEVLLEDRLNHASLIDGATLSGARLVRYAHADAQAAATRVREFPKTSLIASDGVFSMDGDLAPVRELAALARQQQAWLLIDDAHGLGVLGAHGGGVLELAGLGAAEVPLLMGTLGKALGSFGAFVAGDAPLIDYLLQRARSYIYTTALPPAVAAASSAALALVRSEGWRRTRLADHVQRFRAGAAKLGFTLGASTTPIQPLLVGTAFEAVALSAALRAAGFWVAAIRPPTVPAGSARLRVTLSAAHAEADIDALLVALAELKPRALHGAGA